MRKIDIAEYKKILFDRMIKIDYVCKENGLTYMLCYGTLLGAVRHKGFIPWDDDVDIIMPRDDYEKLCSIFRENDYGTNFICIETNKETVYPYGKACAANTFVKEKNIKEVSGYGAFVDIFPMDYVPDDETERQKDLKKFIFIRKVIEHSASTGYEKSEDAFLNFKRAFALFAGKFISTGKLIERVTKDLKKRNKKQTNRMGVVWDICFEKEEVYKTSTVLFENHEFSTPGNPDSILKKLYGDYMKLPPEKERHYKHHLECYVLDDPQNI